MPFPVGEDACRKLACSGSDPCSMCQLCLETVHRVSGSKVFISFDLPVGDTLVKGARE